MDGIRVPSPGMSRAPAIAAVAAAALIVVPGCGHARHEGAMLGDDGAAVVTTVAPLTDLVRQVMKGRGEPTGLVPDGVDSHTYEPSPRDARTLSEAKLFIANGMSLEEPVLRLAEANLPADGLLVTLADRTVAQDEWVFDFSFPNDGGVPNPHLWLDVGHAMDYVKHIRDSLVDCDPEGRKTYHENTEDYLKELTALDEAITEALHTVPEANRKLVTYHDSWPYFGQRYGIDVVGAVQPSDFSEPSAAEVRKIIEQVDAEHVPAVFGSEAFPSPVVAVIADEAEAVYVEKLRDDELPGQRGDPEHSYIGMMVLNVRAMVDNLGGDSSALLRVDPTRD